MNSVTHCRCGEEHQTRHPGCTCQRNERGQRETTVACVVHHVLSCGCLAAFHEYGCESCMEFVCNLHSGAGWYDDLTEDDGAETYVCADCGAYGESNGTLKRKEAESVAP